MYNSMQKIAEKAFLDELEKIALTPPSQLATATGYSFPTLKSTFNVSRQLYQGPARKKYLRSAFNLAEKKPMGFLSRLSSFIR